MTGPTTGHAHPSRDATPRAAGVTTRHAATTSETRSDLETRTRRRYVAARAMGVTAVTPRGSVALGELRLRRLPLQHRLQVGERLLDLALLEPDRSRDPIHRAELVDDRALDPRDRVRLELVAAAWFELLERVDQTEHPVRHQVRLL